MQHKKSLSLPAWPSSPSSYSPASTCSYASESASGGGSERGSGRASGQLIRAGAGHTASFASVDLDASAGAGHTAPESAPTPDSERTPTPASADYVELLARSNFSFLRGASHPEEMVEQAKRLGYKGLALADVNGLYGVVRGHQAAERPSHFDAEGLALHQERGADFRYHVGAELTPFDASPLVLLPMNIDGYRLLSRLITRVKRPAAKAKIKLSFDELVEEAGDRSGDLIAIALPPWTDAQIERLHASFGDRLYLPVTKDYTWSSIALARQALAYETKLGVQLIASQRPLFHAPERRPLHDILTCLHEKTTLQEAHTRLLTNSERHLKPLHELQELYRDRPDLLTRTLDVSRRLQFSLRELRYKYPQELIPPGETSASFLKKLVEQGVEWRYPAWTPPEILRKARAQVAHELELIRDLEYEDYFLTLWDVCQFARTRGILHQGRGSAANSIVCFALGLTAIDPIKLGLLFERFLSRERNEPPDIDIDFEHERREEVIQYIYQKYGAERAAMVCTTICYRSRLAIRDVARAFGVPTPTVDALVKYMGREGLSRLQNPAAHEPFDPTRYGLTPERFDLLVRRARELVGFPRHLGIHTGGFIISHEPVIDLVPVEAATMTNRYVIQWNKDDVNLLGLMKIDVLSLGMLTAIRKALETLQRVKKIEHDLTTIPQEDPATYEMIQRAQTTGVFQIESRAQMALLPRLKPRTWYDLVISVAIVRPGPIQGGMVHPYLRRRDGLERVSYAHPRLRKVLQKTLGVPLFQEQIMQIAVEVAGFTPGEADELRRVVSSAWKKKAVMHGLRQRLINGMLANGLSTEYADQIYRVIEGFASYGFPESHAASFALITYVSCWLKRHHPDVFVASLLNSQPMGFYPPRQLIHEAQRNGVRFLPLDVNHSHWDYEVIAPGLIRTGLRCINGLSELDAQKIIAARGASCGDARSPQSPEIAARDAHIGASPNAHVGTDVPPLIRAGAGHTASTGASDTSTHDQNVLRAGAGYSVSFTNTNLDARAGAGHSASQAHETTTPLTPTTAPASLTPFRDLEDFVRRTRLARKTCTRLAQAGALSALESDARLALYRLQGINYDQGSFFYASEPVTQQDDGRENISRESQWQRVQREFATKGFALDTHPLKLLRPQLQRTGTRTAAELTTLGHGADVQVAGLLTMMQKPPTAKGVAFLSLEDETGISNIILMPEVYQRLRLQLYASPILHLRGRLEARHGVRHLKASELLELADL